LILKFRVQFSILLNVLKVYPKFDVLINAVPQELCGTRRVFRVWHLPIIFCVHSSTRHNEAITTTDKLSAVPMREVSNALLITHQAGDDSVRSTISDIRTGRPSLQF